jgi:hypothetical protein
MPNFVIFSLFLYLIFSGEKSCYTLLIIQRLKRGLLKGFGEDDDTIEEEEQEQKEEKKEKLVIKFEDKYLDRMKTAEEKELTVERLDSLKDSFVMENTPQGNVVMFWDNKRDTFAYYADHLIPYRFLEVVGRKYVLMNDCKKLFVNMDEEIKAAEKRLEEKKQKKEDLKQEEQKRLDDPESANTVVNVEKPKKDVFAKLKSYNRDSSIKSATVALNPKKPSNVPKNTAVNTKVQEDMILKENANRYSYQGKLVNFSFLKKVDRKTVDKNYAMSFAEFKKMKISENKS